MEEEIFEEQNPMEEHDKPESDTAWVEEAPITHGEEETKEEK